MDQVTLTKSEYRAKQWASLISECQSSGQTVVGWCTANGVSTKSYYYWLRKLRLKAIEQTGLTPIQTQQAPVTFQKLQVSPPAKSLAAAVVVHLPSATLEINNGADRNTIEAVLLALKSSC